MQDQTKEIFCFSQALPTDSKKDVAALLRWVAKTIDKLGHIEVLDINFEQPYVTGDQPFLTVFYSRSGQPLDSEVNARVKKVQIEINARDPQDAAHLLTKMAHSIGEHKLPLSDVMGTSFHNVLDKNGDDKFLMTVYYETDSFKTYVMQWDPMGFIADGFPKDEYDPEAYEITLRYDTRMTNAEVAALVHGVFVERMALDPPGFLEDCRKRAPEMKKLLQKGGSGPFAKLDTTQ